VDRYHHTRSLGHLTGLAGRLFNNLLTRRFSEAGIEMTAEQWGVILVLRNNGVLTQGQLGEMLHLDKSTVSRSVSGLQRRGWVQGQRTVEDGRQKRVSLTSQAIDVAERCSAIASRVLVDAQAGLDDAAVAASLEHLSTVVGSLRALNPS
jgi:MarR family transcriptional regulator, multiple antibiotic resistance protein MarR